MKKLSIEADFNQVINDDKLSIIVFKTTWCADCHFINPFMPDLENQYKDDVQFYEIDRDELGELCMELNIMGIPSFIAFKKGQELVRFVSKLRKTREEIEQFVNRAIEVGKIG